jgi:hypothetical protein
MSVITLSGAGRSFEISEDTGAPSQVVVTKADWQAGQTPDSQAQHT